MPTPFTLNCRHKITPLFDFSNSQLQNLDLLSIALYMDEHIHRAITTGLRLRGVDVLTAQEDHQRNIPDPILLDRAAELQRVMYVLSG